MHSEPGEPFHECAYDDWLARYYDDWYPPNDDAYRLLIRLFETFPELAGRSRATIELWDCACGTGATFMPLSKAGYRPLGSDGSAAMLERARQKCMREGVHCDRLRPPLSWNDYERCQAAFGANRFDIVFALNNSLCHMPRAHGYLDVALRCFFDVLKPGGRLIVDTKRYADAPALRGVAMNREMRWADGAWAPRGVRCDDRIVDGVATRFHTSLVYDVDPVFQCCRATILTTIQGRNAPRTHALHYYPLPAAELSSHLSAAGFEVELIPARTPPFEWAYDCLIAQRPLSGVSTRMRPPRPSLQ